ncbi:MAG: cation:dicarboxylase symporter family transporter [Myxococcota bacterium]|nr:cation:dicarboxylase symporter family transporter [Myxococcota bacterium]
MQARLRVGLSLGTRILIGLLLGIAIGLFVGELAAPLRIAGDVFVGLLQMTVLPYIIVTLIASVGQLSLSSAKSLGLRAVSVWLLLLVVGMVVLGGLSLAFPERREPSFYSAPPTASAELDLVGLFVPVNVFQSLSRNAVPGVVVFCILVGAALITLPEKARVIRGLEALGAAIARVNGYVVRLTPYGVLAIAAAAAGTMTVEEFGRLRGYFLLSILATLILAFWLLPALVSACTPFRGSALLVAGRDALVTAFATGKVLVVLPMLVEATQKLFRSRELAEEHVDPSIEVLYPLAYPFPYLGKLMALLFVPFAAAFVGERLGWIELPALFGVGTFALFGGPAAAIPLLLDALELPTDMYQLFLLSGVLVSRLGDVVGVAHLMAFTVITTCALTGTLRIRPGRLVAVLAITGVLVGAVAQGSRLWLDSRKDDYARAKVIEEMHPVNTQQLAPRIVFTEAAPNPVPLDPGETRLERIHRRGILRVGYEDGDVPFVFRNGKDELVGLDVEMANDLAEDLGVTLEFVPLDRRDVAAGLRADHFDIAMSGLVGGIDRAMKTRLSRSYLEGTAAIVVRDHMADELSDPEALRERRLRVGIITGGRPQRAAEELLGQLELVPIPSSRWFFETDHDLDALLVSAESGAAWSMLYPEYRVIIPTRRPVGLPFCYAMHPDAVRLARFVDQWVLLAETMGRIETLTDYWLYGEGAEEEAPRWSILRDVLGWVE